VTFLDGQAIIIIDMGMVICLLTPYNMDK